jgi:hypothetical protein
MNHVIISDTPSPLWLGRTAPSATLFNSPAWAQVLNKGFGATPLYISMPAEEVYFVITRFRAGPFSIGYVGFPAGGTIGRPLAADDVVALARFLRTGRSSLDVLRIPVSAFGPVPSSLKGGVAAPETAIVELPGWNHHPPSKVRRALRRAERQLFSTASTANPDDASELHRLYLSTIQRHRGAARYTEAYFRALLDLSGRDARLRCFIARDSGDVVGFVIAALEIGTAYYLHGSTHADWLNRHIADVLMTHTLAWAEETGAQRFNFMSSPVSQPGLVRFKEKFGGETRQHRTVEVPIRPVRHFALRSVLNLLALGEKVVRHA